MLGIIGGTGLYKIDGLEIIDQIHVKTPFGSPSAPIIKFKTTHYDLMFLPRHGINHQFLPHEINYRANIFALKKLGVKQVIGVSAVGSLQENIHPGEYVIPSQYFDWIKGQRNKTFFGDGLAAHISTAVPTCPNLTNWISDLATKINMPHHKNKTYACVDGPRLGTKAESQFLRLSQCHVVGMTNVPEVFLAREAQLCYATIGIVTDYDCWLEDPEQHVSVCKVIERYSESLSKLKKLLHTMINTQLPKIEESYRQSLKTAVLTPEEAIPDHRKEMLNVLRL